MEERNKISVLIIVPALEVTGPAKGIFQQLKYYTQKRGNFVLYNFRLNISKLAEDPFLMESQKLGIDVHFFNQTKRLDYSLLKKAEIVLKSENINIVQSHGFKPAVISAYLKFKYGIKWICFMHGTIVQDFKLRVYNILDKILQLYADRVILVCEAHRNKIYGGSNKKRVKVINNGIEISNPVNTINSKKDVKRNLGILEQQKIVVGIGRLSYEKGFDTFIKSINTIVKTYPEIIGIIVGDGPMKEELEKLIHRFHLQGIIKLVGFSKSPGDYMQIADVIVSPSRSEGMPNVILEAMALGKPIVATNVGGVTEMIEREKNGLIVLPNNPSEISDAVIRVLSDKKYSHKIGCAAFERVKEKFNCNKRAEEIYKIYGRLICSP